MTDHCECVFYGVVGCSRLDSKKTQASLSAHSSKKQVDLDLGEKEERRCWKRKNKRKLLGKRLSGRRTRDLKGIAQEAVG